MGDSLQHQYFSHTYRTHTGLAFMREMYRKETKSEQRSKRNSDNLIEHDQKSYRMRERMAATADPNPKSARSEKRSS